MNTLTSTVDITTWPQFATAIRSKNCNLLKRLDDFPNSILITGCQRSGTTMLSRIVTESEGMVNYWFGPDDELDAALILSGYVEHAPQGRYCFQTTYLNECFREYYEHAGGHKIIWVLRSPFSVIYSMLYNWKDYALDELFQSCGVPLLRGLEKGQYQLLGHRGVSKLRRACFAYQGKVAQLFELRQHFGSKTLMVVDYDDLVRHKGVILPQIYQFFGLLYHADYTEKINSKSLNKANHLSKQELSTIEALCQPTYLKARKLLTITNQN